VGDDPELVAVLPSVEPEGAVLSGVVTTAGEAASAGVMTKGVAATCPASAWALTGGS
jgi:hypothetical protein